MPHQSLSAVILAGGLGTRLKALVAQTPKPLLPVAGRPFLHYLIHFLRQHGIRDIVCCVGYLGQTIIDQLGDGVAWDVRIRYVTERELLGTGGAIHAALPEIPGEQFFILNGDTFFNVDLARLTTVHASANDGAVMALWSAPATTRYGVVVLAGDGRVQRFMPRDAGRSAGYINGGIYLAHRSIFHDPPARMFSLEQDLFPRLAAKGRLFGVPFEGNFIDIGVPEDYQNAQQLLPQWVRLL